MDRVICGWYSFFFLHYTVINDYGDDFGRPSDDIMQSKFEPVGDSQFLTFVISFNPPDPLSIFATLPVPPMAVQDPGPSRSFYLLVRFVLRLHLIICSVGFTLRKRLYR
jgi:hypothetical protein